jgi:hypothetical protein
VGKSWSTEFYSKKCIGYFLTRLRRRKLKLLIFHVKKPSIPINGPSLHGLNFRCLEKWKGNARVFSILLEQLKEFEVGIAWPNS